MAINLKKSLLSIIGATLISSNAYGFETKVEGFDVVYNFTDKGKICIQSANYDGSLKDKYPFGKLSIKFEDCYGTMESAIHNGKEVGWLGRKVYEAKIRKQYKIFQNEIEGSSRFALNNN